MRFDVALVLSYLPAIGWAAITTVGLWIVALVASIVIGLAIAVIRLHGGAIVNTVLRLLVEAIRGTPFLIQLFLLYFGGPFIGLTLERLPAGLLALSLFGGCYMSEVFRTGIRAVPRGHIEAAECVGLSQMQILRRILLPEMLVLVLPAGTNIAVGLIKETAVLSVIGVPELTAVISGIGSETYAFVEALTLLSLCYWALVEICARLGRTAEQRLSLYRFAA
ncbi:amino acid ABC transporter permease [Bosea caraganae]|uniref:Amino acid ABC transporter permease n=1 Tax=Bosea caraganae TaxID=2763117 RepID=A0A370L8V8_9HYPH|nr:amino acid ABC transporter permease [Bosea caraganae]RDJ26821.1 amino acid ABC transporter permease [Bosea caraganae]RDJ30707.1 amino acid ABC transporter permease [Bosea caraganae]